MGSLVSADVVLKNALNNDVPDRQDEPDPGHTPDRIAELRNEILEICRQNLPPHKVPATIRCVTALRMAAAGKLVRSHA